MRAGKYRRSVQDYIRRALRQGIGETTVAPICNLVRQCAFIYSALVIRHAFIDTIRQYLGNIMHQIYQCHLLASLGGSTCLEGRGNCNSSSPKCKHSHYL